MVDSSDLLPDPVTTKSRSFRLWLAGAFGCRLRSWDTVGEWRRSGHRGPVALRVREGSGGGPCAYDVAPEDVMVEVLETFETEGVSADQVMVNEMSPSEAILVQGEYWRVAHLGPGGYPAVGYFRHSRARSHMRDALRYAPHDGHGLQADLLLRSAMTPSSYEDFRELVDLYPDHVLEVSVFDRCLGNLPGRNALVWEVRRY